MENNNSILLCNNMIDHIFSYLHVNDIKFISKKNYNKYKKRLDKSISTIKNKYMKIKLHGDIPYDNITLKTLKRFYITKYRPEWLREFPISYTRILISTGYITPTDPIAIKYLEPSEDQNNGYVKNFLECCSDYNITMNDFISWGW